MKTRQAEHNRRIGLALTAAVAATFISGVAAMAMSGEDRPHILQEGEQSPGACYDATVEPHDSYDQVVAEAATTSVQGVIISALAEI